MKVRISRIVGRTGRSGGVVWNEGHMRREVRITLVIPSHDRALVRFETAPSLRTPLSITWLSRRFGREGLRAPATVCSGAFVLVRPRTPALKAG